jgi:ATP-dependent HslUV protease ATP-binding subunit HslU
MSHLLNEFLYDVPDVIGANEKLVVTRQMVKDRLNNLVKDKDLSHYIL